MAESLNTAKGYVFHSDLVLQQWHQLNKSISMNAEPITLDGRHLTPAQVVSIARYGSATRIDPFAYRSLTASCEALRTGLEGGEIIYGVNTGFGGSADVRTKQTEQLQRTLIRELHYGILPPGARDNSIENLEDSISLHRYDLSFERSSEPTYLPWTWTRAAILIRINSLIKGCSGVRPVVVDRLQDLLKHDIIPMIPLRGSISASGDLSPLSYIGGAIQGKPTIRIVSSEQKELYADQAFNKVGLLPLSLQAKEGLAIVNGTAISTAAGALALHDAHGLAVLSQILTSMSVEALTGTVESFHPFFAEARPHPGQTETAHNVRRFLDGSKLVKVNNGTEASLRQDRYSIRTAPQWLGPVLEDLILAHQQLFVECNSATDNPLVNPEGTFLHGGNFQAKAVTAAMEKTRQAMQAIGRMLFTQCVEMINPATSRGLPPNLVAEDPSASFIFKGTDINIAALQAELGFLSNPVNHVQSAEMGNQALNSLALLSARYTHTSIDVLSQMAAAHLVAVCQALDLRAMHIQYLESYRLHFRTIVTEAFKDHSNTLEDVDSLSEALWQQLLKAFDASVSMDSKDRFPFIAKSLRTTCIDRCSFSATADPLKAIADFTEDLTLSLYDTWCIDRDAYLAHGDATPVLGEASKQLYTFVRHSLRVPLLCTSRLTTPRTEDLVGRSSAEAGIGGRKDAPTVGSYTGVVYRAVRDGTLSKVATDTLRAVR